MGGPSLSSPRRAEGADAYDLAPGAGSLAEGVPASQLSAPPHGLCVSMFSELSW